MAKTLMQGRKPTTRKKYVNIIQGRKRQSNTKTDKILEHLKTHGEITSWEAIIRASSTKQPPLYYFF